MPKDSKRKILKFAPEMTKILKSYVYVYVDPRNSESFYVGRGKGNRSFAHLNERNKMKKVARITAIRKSGCEPRIDILRYGMTNDEASLVEAAAIDLVGFSKLTNAVRGNHRGTFGRISSKDLITMLTAKPAKIEHEAILIIINRLYRSEMTAEELYEATRGVWKIGPKRDKAELAMAVYQGIVREVYRIRRWLPAGSLRYKTRDSRGFKSSGRWEFQGLVAHDVRDGYVGFSVRRILGKARNPIRYVKPA
ncbi:MAG: hypothetical protein LAN18_04520 [Acidobacteriia bacterium]|nr:hypothetical protein [Terriglobia bacterium]